MLRFSKSTVIKAPVEIVWQFHQRLDVLEKLTPPWQPVQIVRREGGLDVGAVTEFRIMLGVIPVRWVAKHIECEQGRSFTDVQAQGPMTSWRHEHQFTPLGDQTRLTDTINYEIPGGMLVELLLGWWVNSRLEEMFKYRHLVTQRECERKII